ncbi:uncharacterized protein METZ01_LOCUS462685, partial [marine metagenome]
PSIVTKCLPTKLYASAIQVLMLLYTMICFLFSIISSPITAVQAPQSPEAQPSLLPTRLLSRSHCNTVVFGFIKPSSIGVMF